MVDLTHEWWTDTATGSKSPTPVNGSQVWYSLALVNLDGSATAVNVVVVDTVPTPWGTLDETIVPGGWAVDFTQTGTGGRRLAVFSRPTFFPMESATLWIKFTVTISSFGEPITSLASVSNSGYCGGPRYQGPEQTATFGWFGDILMTIRISDTHGRIIHSWNPVYVGVPVTQLRFTYTTAGGCATWVSDPALPFSPDGNCVNDILRVMFDELGGYDYGFWWDGRDSAGSAVPCGFYQVVGETLDPVSGDPVFATRTVELSCSSRVHVPEGDARVVGGRQGYVNLGDGESAHVLVRPDGAGLVRLRVFNRSGALVREISREAGDGELMEVRWDGRDASDRPVISGVYLLTIEAPGVRRKERVALVR